MPVTRQQLFARLSELGIASSTVEHPPAFTVEEARALRGAIPGAHIKNLFLKDKKEGLWLLVCEEETAVDLKSLPARIGSARLSFGRPDLLREVLGVEPGSVTPFAVINDRDGKVTVVLDRHLLAAESVNCHPLVNTATTTIASADLLRFLRACGHEPRIIDFP
jgi:Ala-tRNA(Pro) deacylase